MICALCGFPSDILVPCKCGDVYCSTCRELHECEAVAGPPLWPHQAKAMQEVIRLIESGVQQLLMRVNHGAPVATEPVNARLFRTSRFSTTCRDC